MRLSCGKNRLVTALYGIRATLRATPAQTSRLSTYLTYQAKLKPRLARIVPHVWSRNMILEILR